MLQEEYATATCELDQSPQFVRTVRKTVAGAISRRGMRDGILSVADQAVVSGTSFVTSVIIGRMCSKRELGVFYLALTIVYFARGIQDQLISAPYVIHCHKRRANSLALYSGSSFLHHLMLSLVSIALLGGAIAVLSFGSRPAGLVSAFWVLLGALPLLQLREFVRRLTTANLQIATAIAIDVGVAVLQIGGLLLLAYFDRLTVGAAYAVMGAACAVASCGWFFSQRQPFRFTLSQAILDWRHNWGFARWALASHLVGFSGVYLLPWIVMAMRGSEEAGV